MENKNYYCEEKVYYTGEKCRNCDQAYVDPYGRLTCSLSEDFRDPNGYCNVVVHVDASKEYV